MKPNLELQRAILIFLEEKEGFSNHESITVDGFTDEHVSYNIKLMCEENLVDAVKSIRTDTDKFEQWKVASCTASGHQYLAALKNDSNFKRLKIEASTLPYKMLPIIATEMLKATIQSALN